MGHAYRCFCPKERLDALRESARKLHPPSMASYDRKCSHLSQDESSEKASRGIPYTVRFKAPLKYPEFYDLLHGKLNLQTQVNPDDIRYDDLVLVKSDGLPTYHLANVVDDHLMKITHVVRGEEWLASTPKHVAMYNAFGWKPPSFVHIPLLTTVGNKKLSKRSGDIGVLSLASKGILPEAMINYVALYGWSPHREGSEVFTLKELESAFTLDGLTKGNAKVDEKKLEFLNKHFFQLDLNDNSKSTFNEMSDKIYNIIKSRFENTEKKEEIVLQSDIPKDKVLDKKYSLHILDTIKKNLTSVDDYFSKTSHLYFSPDLGKYPADSESQSLPSSKFLKQTFSATNGPQSTLKVINDAISLLQKNKGKENESTSENLFIGLDSAKLFIDTLVEQHSSSLKKSQVLQTLRYALTGSSPGIDVPTNISLLSSSVAESRLHKAAEHISSIIDSLKK